MLWVRDSGSPRFWRSELIDSQMTELFGFQGALMGAYFGGDYRSES